MSAGWNDLVAGFGKAELWLFLGWRDVRKHYSRTLLGPLWLTLSMGVLIGSLGVLYSRIFHMDVHQYMPFLSVGFVLWNLISGVITGACYVFPNATGFIRQTHLPLSMYMLKFVWSHLITFFHNFAIYVVVAIVFAVNPGVEVLLAIPALAVLSLNALFVTMILGPLCARFRDIPMIVASVVQVMFFMTPIIWSADQLSGNGEFVRFNPFYHFIEIVRAPLLGETIQGGNWIAAGAMTIIHGAIGFLVFSRLRSRIAYWI